MASPARYGVRSVHLASRNAGTIGVDGRVIVHIRSGRSLLAWMVAHFGSKSANGMWMTLSLTFIALLSACSWAFCSRVGVTSPPEPGGSLTAWKSVFGYEVQPGLMSPSGLPGRSGVGPWLGMNVGSLPSATPLGWAATVGAAAAGALVA